MSYYLGHLISKDTQKDKQKYGLIRLITMDPIKRLLMLMLIPDAVPKVWSLVGPVPAFPVVPVPIVQLNVSPSSPLV